MNLKDAIYLMMPITLAIIFWTYIIFIMPNKNLNHRLIGEVTGVICYVVIIILFVLVIPLPRLSNRVKGEREGKCADCGEKKVLYEHYDYIEDTCRDCQNKAERKRPPKEA